MLWCCLIDFQTGAVEAPSCLRERDNPRRLGIAPLPKGPLGDAPACAAKGARYASGESFSGCGAGSCRGSCQAAGSGCCGCVDIFGWPTLLIAHITFNIPYVIFNVGPKLRQLDPSLYNAALDLGCTPRQAFTKVIMPQLSPAILSAFLICLTYSIDDFMISYFNSGTMQTLPIAIYSMTRKKVSPEINALSAVIFCVILAIILISNAADSRAYRRNQKAIRKAMLDEGGR